MDSARSNVCQSILGGEIHLSAAVIVAIDRSCVAYSISHHHRRFPMNFETCDIDDFPTIGATELDGSSGGSSSVDENSRASTTLSWFVYNGDSNTPYAEFNGSGTLLERYLAGPSYVPGVTGMIARTNASGVTDWYLTGKLGSVRDIINTSGSVIDHISYGAFGSIRAETNPSSGSRFKFDGMQYDTITGLYNDWHRGYSSWTGRFISQDPMGFAAGDSNIYRYIMNIPQIKEDPSGYGEQMHKSHGIPVYSYPGYVIIDPSGSMPTPKQILLIPETGGGPSSPLSLPQSGVKYPADGLFLPDGVLKIPDSVVVTITFDSGGGYSYTYERYDWPFIKLGNGGNSWWPYAGSYELSVPGWAIGQWPSFSPNGTPNPFNTKNPLAPISPPSTPTSKK